ncbi:SAM-dependent methyltransferase [Nocardia bovistercoris]|uniref:Class I SAM-dependent methyltransferase n=1 Tax=Nocardia bovistercoris TaxID=2785916 RepID=A0A931IB44_9NOCA|nr:class I SAM-dependent methyltransferase [Nocardia bovistercoris]MBH0778169.1 class I SAM-dependent methyltransferase [Nocardia bovistercoris]
MSDTTTDAREFWETFYTERDRIWSGEPNPLLVREAADLAPGRALDLGCGEGGDAIWLAARGWQVTAVDISATALARTAEHAAQAGVGERIVTAEHDLRHSFPDGAFDLVSAQFFHSPVGDTERLPVLRRAAEAVASGGVLLIAGHAGWPSFVEGDHEHSHVHLPSTDEVLAGLDLPEQRWRVEAAEEVEREVTWPDGRTGTRADNIVRLRRLD